MTSTQELTAGLYAPLTDGVKIAPTPTPPVLPWYRRRRRVQIATVIVFLVVVAIVAAVCGAILGSGGGPAPPPPTPTLVNCTFNSPSFSAHPGYGVYYGPPAFLDTLECFCAQVVLGTTSLGASAYTISESLGSTYSCDGVWCPACYSFSSITCLAWNGCPSS